MDRLLSTGLALAAALAPAAAAQAHGGGLDRHGCHHDRKNGGYHCHRGSGPTASSMALAAGGGGNNLTGYVTSTSTGGAFRNCSAARAAGAAPMRRGDPGYGSHLDRDNDGVGCE